MVSEFAAERGLTFTILLDEQALSAITYQVHGIPTSFFIDGGGIIRARYGGALDEATIDQYVRSLLQ